MSGLYRHVLGALAIAVIVSYAPHAWTQSEQQASPPAETSGDAATPTGDSAANSPTTKPSARDEIIVSAAYREQDVQDVVGGIQVFGGQALDKRGATGVEDYLREVSSVSLQKSGVGKSNIAIRGISNLNTLDIGYADGSPTTGIYFNDIAIQGSGVFPDLDIYDLERIEVLKGPQGTLYGEGSMGGAVKMIMNKPDMQNWVMRAAATYSQTADASDANWDMRGAVNIPILQDRLALRLVGTGKFKSGFVTYSGLGDEDPDDEDGRSLRAIVGWQAMDRLSAEYTFLYDRSNRKQLPVVEEGQEEEPTNTRTEDQYARTTFTVHNLTVNADLRFATLTSVTSYFNTEKEVQRRIPILQGLINSNFGELPVEAFPKGFTHVLTDLESISQELRLVSAGDERLDWVAGLFFRDRDQKFYQDKHEEFGADDPAGIIQLLVGPDVTGLSGVQEAGFGAEPFRQYAAYGEATYEILPSSLEATLGVRWFSDAVEFFQDTEFFGVEAALFATDPNNVDPETGRVTVYFGDEFQTEDFLFKGALAWYPTDQAMIYGSVSRGFRSGTPNLFAALESGPPIVRPDFVLNYELGAKTSWFNDSLIVNLAAYQIDWTDLQGLVVGTACLGAACGIPFAHLGNGGDAVVRGAELQAQLIPMDMMAISFGVGYNDGEITDPAPDNDVKKGSELPNKPKWTVTLGGNYSLPLTGGLMLDLSGTATYVDEQLTVFQSEDVPDGIPLDAYYMFKASVGLSGDNWRAQLFGDNITDERIVVAKSLPSPQSSVMRPRTIGVRVAVEY